MTLRNPAALHWLHQAGMHQPMILEARHMKAPGKGTKIERETTGTIAIIILHARHWLRWADMHQRHQHIQERLSLPGRYRCSLGIVMDPLTNPTPAAALADTMKDLTRFRHRTRPSLRLHTSTIALNSDIALGSLHQPRLNQPQNTKDLPLIAHRF